MTKADILRALDYLGHIVEAINDRATDSTQKNIVALVAHSKAPLLKDCIQCSQTIEPTQR